jgi:2-phosphosulfolactate phosphatase
MKSLEVLFAPAEFMALGQRDLSQTVCAVFDVLRATSTIAAALANGALSIQPVETIEAAIALKKQNPDLLLAGEREGLRISSALTGSIDFDFGNSPREFPSQKIAGKDLAITTTNGSRAIFACRGALKVFTGSFLNLSALAAALESASKVLIVCGGTHEEASYEDALGAGALCELLWPRFLEGHLADSARMARIIYQQAAPDLMGAFSRARNGRRLLALPDLAPDVHYCLQRDKFNVVPSLTPEGKLVLL